MFELPDYTGRDPEYIQSSLTFYLYHARQTLRGRKQKKALEAIRAISSVAAKPVFFRIEG